MAQSSSPCRVPFDPGNTQSYIHYDDGSKEETLKTGWDVSHMKPAEMEFPKVTSTEERCIEQMLLDGSISQIGHSEVSLRVIVEAGQGADVAYRVDDDAEDGQEDDDSSKNR